jgi:hypothetical protein
MVKGSMWGVILVEQVAKNNTMGFLGGYFLLGLPSASQTAQPVQSEREGVERGKVKVWKREIQNVSER